MGRAFGGRRPSRKRVFSQDLPRGAGAEAGNFALRNTEDKGTSRKLPFQTPAREQKMLHLRRRSRKKPESCGKSGKSGMKRGAGSVRESCCAKQRPPCRKCGAQGVQGKSNQSWGGNADQKTTLSLQKEGELVCRGAGIRAASSGWSIGSSQRYS